MKIAENLKISKFKTLKKLDLVYKILDHQASNPEEKESNQEKSDDKAKNRFKPRNKSHKKEVKKEDKSIHLTTGFNLHHHCHLVDYNDHIVKSLVKCIVRHL